MKIHRMNLEKKQKHRGIVGVEASFIIIAFVLVSAGIAYVVINGGFSTSQKAKTAIGSTLAATSSIEIEGKVIGSSYLPLGGEGSLNVTSVPIKMAQSGEAVNLSPSQIAVRYQSDQITYDNIYNGTLNARAQPTHSSLESATNAAATYDTSTGGKIVNQSPFNGGTDADSDDWPTETTAFIYWTVQNNANDKLEKGEHANLVVVFASGDRPQYLDEIKIELIQADGASLAVQRDIPVISTQVIDLG